jgi:hypothetical protein
LGFTPFIKTGSSGKTYICCDVVKSCHGIGSSGLLSQVRLIAQLHSHDYIQTATPCLFRHKTRDITFCLVVDDFAATLLHNVVNFPISDTLLTACLNYDISPQSAPCLCIFSWLCC